MLRIVPLLLGVCGCVATHAVGLVEPVDGGVRVSTIEGERYRLALGPESAPMAWLDGHLVEVDGPRAFGRLHVRQWRVIEGRHGMPTWVGVLESRGVQIGLQDRNSGAFYVLDADGAETVRPYLGKTVLVEGYVEGAHRVRVVYFRVLAEES